MNAFYACSEAFENISIVITVTNFLNKSELFGSLCRLAVMHVSVLGADTPSVKCVTKLKL